MPFSDVPTQTRLMQVAEAIQARNSVAAGRKHARRRSALRDLEPATLQRLRLDQLRAAVHDNLVSFPSQVPIFERHDRPDLQRRMVQLYFTFGWSCATIAARFGLLRQRVGQVLSTWRRRAVETGYIQFIPRENGFIPEGVEIVLWPVVRDACVPVAADVPSPNSPQASFGRL